MRRSFVLRAAICALVAALSLFEATFHRVGLDQGVWTYMGWVWEAHGMAPYSGAMDNKTPGIHMLYAVFVRCFGIGIWPHAVTGTAAFMVTALLVYSLALRIYDQTAAYAAMLLFALTMTMPSLSGALLVEPFVAMFSTAAFCLVLTPRGQRRPRGTRYSGLRTPAPGGRAWDLRSSSSRPPSSPPWRLCIAAGVLEARRSGRAGGAARCVAIVVLGNSAGDPAHPGSFARLRNDLASILGRRLGPAAEAGNGREADQPDL